MGNEKPQVGVIGLGKFGLSFARHLVELGHEVLGLDNNPAHIKQAQELALNRVVKAMSYRRWSRQ